MSVSVCIDIGGTDIKFGVVMDCKVIKSMLYSTPKEKDKFEELIISKTRELIVFCEKEYPRHKIKHIGIACPGPADYKKGIIKETPNIIFARNYNLVRLVSIFKYPIKMDNDGNCFTLANAIMNKNWQSQNVVGLVIGTGIGGGFCSNAILYRGLGNACEVGHLRYNDENDYEEYYHKIIEKYTKELNVDSLAMIANLCRKNHENAILAFSEIGRHLGLLCREIVLAYDPGVIVIGGKVSLSWSFIKKDLQNTLKERKGIIYHLPQIVRNTIPHANLIGASLLNGA